MLIDWFTVAAQIVNFLILMWLLKRFLYKPILKAIDKRNEKIKSQLEEAASKKAEAEKEKTEYNQKNADFEKQKDLLINKANEEADTQRKQLLEKARKEAEELRSRLQKSLQEEKQNLNKEINEKIQNEVFAISRKVLTDMASVTLEEHVNKAFIHRLKDLQGEERDQFINVLKSAHEIDVTSAFDLPQEQQKEIEETIKGIANDEIIKVNFKINDANISGIKLITGGYKLSWNISDYLTSLENSLSELIEDQNINEKEKQEAE